MKTQVLFSLFLIGTLFLGCKKDAIYYTLEGVVIDQSAAQPLIGATVSLFTAPAGSSSLTLVQSVQSGSDGSYSFQLQRDKIASVVLKAAKNNYFEITKSYTLDELSVENSNQTDFAIYAKSWVRLRFMGDGIKDVKYIRQVGLNNCAECCPSTEQFVYNAIDESTYCINYGNGEYKIYFNELNSINQGPISVVTTPFDTTELLISY